MVKSVVLLLVREENPVNYGDLGAFFSTFFPSALHKKCMFSFIHVKTSPGINRNRLQPGQTITNFTRDKS